VSRRFFRNSILGALVLLAIAGGIDYAVDPFQQYRIPSFYEPRFYRAYQRHENPGIARNYVFDRAIVGSSFLENISGSEVDRAFGAGTTVNLCLSAITAYDARKLLGVVLASGKVKQVIYSIDFNAFSGSPQRTGFTEPLPLYLYDAAHWNDYPYLLSIVTLGKALNILLGWHETGYRTDRDNPWYWADTADFSAKGVVANLDPRDMNRRFMQPPRTLEAMMLSFEANVPGIVAAHPETQFIFVWPPNSILMWADFRNRGQLDLSLEFKRRFFLALEKYPNVRIHDFQARAELVTNLDEYRDIYHFSPRISSHMVKAIASGEERVTRENLDAGIERLRAAALAVDPARVIAETRAR
jgi:hypothetical protein